LQAANNACLKKEAKREKFCHRVTKLISSAIDIHKVAFLFFSKIAIFSLFHFISRLIHFALKLFHLEKPLPHLSSLRANAKMQELLLLCLCFSFRRVASLAFAIAG
jgi:hypothetical protein